MTALQKAGFQPTAFSWVEAGQEDSGHRVWMLRQLGDQPRVRSASGSSHRCKCGLWSFILMLRDRTRQAYFNPMFSSLSISISAFGHCSMHESNRISQLFLQEILKANSAGGTLSLHLQSGSPMYFTFNFQNIWASTVISKINTFDICYNAYKTRQ